MTFFYIRSIIKMACLKKRFVLYGKPYDDILFNYINGTKYPTNNEWNMLMNFVDEIKFFSKNKERKRIDAELYRGSDFEPIIEANVGDTLDFSTRFFSWTEKYKVAKEVAGFGGAVLILSGDIFGLDLRRVNCLQSEVLIPPINLVVIRKEKLNDLYHIHVIPSKIIQVE